MLKKTGSIEKIQRPGQSRSYTYDTYVEDRRGRSVADENGELSVPTSDCAVKRSKSAHVDYSDSSGLHPPNQTVKEFSPTVQARQRDTQPSLRARRNACIGLAPILTSSAPQPLKSPRQMPRTAPLPAIHDATSLHQDLSIPISPTSSGMLTSKESFLLTPGLTSRAAAGAANSFIRCASAKLVSVDGILDITDAQSPLDFWSSLADDEFSEELMESGSLAADTTLLGWQDHATQLFKRPGAELQPCLVVSRSFSRRPLR